MTVRSQKKETEVQYRTDKRKYSIGGRKEGTVPDLFPALHKEIIPE
jgi:hypothetical protein